MDHCNQTGRRFVRYDPSCLGDLPGDLATVEFHDWVGEEEEVVAGPALLLGSSMGGWISLLIAGHPRHQLLVRALLLVVPAVNFFRPHYARLAAELPEEVVRRLDRGEVHVWEDETGERSAEQELELVGDWGLELLEVVQGEQEELVLRKEAEHRFVEPDSLAVITESIK